VDPALLHVGREALLLALLVSVPPLGAALVVGAVVGVLQAATQVQEPSIAVVPRLAAVLAALALAAPWIGAHVARFARECLELATRVAP
jgi:type III secretory pathway component EscS